MTRRFLILSLLALPTLPAQGQDLYDLDKVREFRLYFQQANYWTQMRQNYASKTNIEAELKVDGVSYKQVGVRFRGNTSYTRLPAGSEKAGFNIETDWKIAGQDLYGYDHLNLNNGYHDPTFMREVITYQIARRYMCAPKANFVKVYLNDQYWGIYINVQQPNKDMMKEWFRSNEGSRYRGFPDRSLGGSFDDSAYNYLGNNAANYRRGWEFKEGDGTDLMNLITVLTQTPSNQLLTDLPKIWSIDQSYRYCVVMNALAHTDSYIGTGKDHMNYRDPTHGRFLMFPFDVNESIGGQGGSANLNPYSNSTNTRRPVLSRTLPLGDMRQRYDAHYRTVLKEVLNWNYIGGLVTKYQAMIAADVARDTKKIYPTSAFTSNVTQDYGFGRSRILGLRPLVNSREAFLKGFASLTATEATLANLTHVPALPKTTDAVTITVRATGAANVTLHWRSQGEFVPATMFDDGNHGDGSANDDVYGAFLPTFGGGTQVDYYASAKTAAGVLSFLPNTAEFQARSFQVQHPTGTSPLVINEALAKNTTVNQDAAGEFDDWVELRNSSSTLFHASGMYLSDKYDNPTKWQIPANQFIPAGGSLLIWCDEDGTQGPLHANFKLSGSGESILLFATDGKTLVGSLAFGPQVDDISVGRLFDGQATPYTSLGNPTPGADNATGAAGLRIYSAIEPERHPMTLGLTGTPKVGANVSFDLADAPASSSALIILSPAAAYLPFLDDTVLLTLGTPVNFVIPTDAAGKASIATTVPNLAGLPGTPFYLQTLAIESGALIASNGLEVIFAR